MSDTPTPVSPEHRPPVDDRPLVIAHRGSSGAYAENTRAAFLHALAEGADGVEVDVHLTRDRHLVCLHDATLERTTNGSGAVSDHTLAQLRRLDVHSWKGARLPGDYGPPSAQLLTLPELVDLLVAAGRPVRLAVELKHPSPFGHELEERALAALFAAGWDPETSRVGAVEVSFMSFYPGSLQYLAPIAGTDHLCQLLTVVPREPVPSRFSLGPLSRAAVRATLRQAVADAERLVREGRTGMAGPGVAYVRRHLADVKAWHAAGRRLRVWTADRPADVELLRGLGVQEITTNLPARVLAQLAARPAPVAEALSGPHVAGYATAGRR
ncbi:glycerophosphodiester phosphodiesterase [Citricoccus sp. SGAir0253]|uniref:glycerophosphodiester phosphodiesterase family protein n=1 Tax=Citricoccus sp. SGAir0253 TaxID=2567881 RepID=UPI0010CCD888|nr:glycerophosphodiester phosphodiesterase family protein [Citricoccus sp. SGAir0253]QCU76878.1 glycerophosphodiester phosphodiesterase [Citricoccus sp. SGAir0253]